MSIDFHVHPWTKDFMLKNGPIVKACNFFRLDTERLPLSIEQLVEEMDSAGIERSVILGQDTHATRNPNFKHYTIRNDRIASIAAKSRDRLVPFAGVDPNAPAEAAKELRRVFGKLGFSGLKIHSSANSVYPNDVRKMYPLCEVCEERGLPILFHTGTTGLGDCEIKYSKPEHLDDVCEKFPDLKVVMAHFGWPWSDVALAIAMRHPNVYLDVSGWRPRYIPQPVLSYMNGPLQDRFVFGTDYPMMRHREWMKDFEANLRPKLKAGVAEKLLKGNAEQLLGP
jgi:predicted TIM-barrel fold metal-dependent hydrolase